MKGRALWYLRKDLADVIEDTDEAFKIRLRFEPNRWLDFLVDADMQKARLQEWCILLNLQRRGN